MRYNKNCIEKAESDHHRHCLLNSDVVTEQKVVLQICRELVYTVYLKGFACILQCDKLNCFIAFYCTCMNLSRGNYAVWFVGNPADSFLFNFATPS